MDEVNVVSRIVRFSMVGSRVPRDRMVGRSPRDRRGTMLMAGFLSFILAIQLYAEVQPVRQWQPPQFTPKTSPVQRVRPIPAGALRMPPSVRQDVIRVADHKNLEKIRQEVQQRVDSVKGVAGKLEQITADKLTGNGSLRQRMVEAGIEKAKIDRAMEEIKAAVPKMREAGKALRESLEKEGAAR